MGFLLCLLIDLASDPTMSGLVRVVVTVCNVFGR